MAKGSNDVGSFRSGALGYLVGAAAGIGLVFLVSWLGLPGWLLNLIDQNQALVQILAIPLIAGFILALGGAVLGGVGGWSLARMLGLKRWGRLSIGSAVAFGISVSVLFLVFLLLIGFLGLYNNLAANPVKEYGIIFGLFGLVFGLLSGLLQSFLTVKLRYTWLVVLAAIVGFALGSVLLGLIVRLVNPTEGYKTHPILTVIVLLIGLALPFVLGGGVMGFTYGRISKRVTRAGEPVESIQPSVWQIVIVAVLGIVIGSSVLGTLGQIGDFLVIQPANLNSQLPTVTVGVQWSEPEPTNGDTGIELPDTAGQKTVTISGPDQTEHKTWCSPEGIVQYQLGDGAVEQISYPGCIDSPGLALDVDGQPHLVWYTEEIRDANGVERPANLLVESIRTDNGWSEPAIVAATHGPVTLSLSSLEEGDLQLVWVDMDQNLYTSIQEVYECNEAELTDLERAGYDLIVNGGFRTAGSTIPWCRNRFDRIQYTPNSAPEYGNVPATENGAFDINAEMVKRVKYEALFTTMQYEPNNTPPSPGSVLAEAAAELYKNVKSNPEDYPRGMTVRIMLGNYPEMSDFAWGTQIIDAISDLRAAGVESMVDPQIGWRMEVANFPGTYPHSHTKFLVVDGRSLISAGYNYGYLHLPADHPSGKGYDMLDLGIQISGPVAQDAISTFDDMWEGADQILCEDFHPSDGSDWKSTCKEVKATSDHVPEVLRTYLPSDGDTNAFSLYRTSEYKEGDEFIAASLAAAEQSVDLMHVNFSLEMICMLNLVSPDLCTMDNALPYMHALLEAIEKNGVRVRVIMENTNSNGLENRVSGVVFMEELERRGLSDLVEMRFYNGKLHAKSTLIDESMLIIGSQNMHYSSFAKAGLTEHSLTTNDLDAIAEYQELFETKWQEAIPFEEAEFGNSP